MSDEKFTCRKCDKIFVKKGRYDIHIQNTINPCDHKCYGCGFIAPNRSAFRRHKTKCEKHKEHEKIVNNVNAVNSHNTQNTQNIDNSVKLTINMNPFGLTHEYLDLVETLNPVRGIIVGLVREENYKKAYQVLFEQIHGNEKYPENHNIYMPHRNRTDVLMFKGRRFKFERVEDEMPGLYRYLKKEMDWIVKTTILDPTEKSQLRWNIQANWMIINEYKDDDMKRILRNNKEVVHNTMKKYIVKPNSDAIIDCLGFTPPDLNKNYIVKLPH